MMRLLDRLSGPDDLKQFSYAELDKLAQEIREEIIHTVAQNGGHLAPNLGVVELTIALHRVYTSPNDKIIWDVGHQSYTHKLLTGRRDQFFTLRQHHGISGFPKPEESIHDAFATGHSSTSISVSLGMAKARDLKGEAHDIVAIIGDGSITGGMALEALNHTGHLKANLTVVLNDNEMSIAPNVGALSSYLSSLRSDPSYFKLKNDVQNALSKIPVVGERLAKTIENLKDAFKYMLVPGIFFEELGFTYLGPVDGHNISGLCRILQEAKNIKGPTLVHVVTQKGKGYKPAEADPARFHGVGPFNIENGESIQSKLSSFTDCFSQALCEEATNDERIVAITAAMAEGTGLKNFSKLFPDRFYDVAIAEQHAVTFAAGLAKSGMKPVVAIYSTFMQRAYDQIIHDVALNKLPVILALDRAGLVGPDGSTHHGAFDLSYLRAIPNLIIFSPKDGEELKDMLHTALKLEQPVAIRYPKASTEKVLGPGRLISPGKAEVLHNGNGLNIIAEGVMVGLALKIREKLALDGIDTGVINIRSLKPLDAALIGELAQKTPLITLENNSIIGGLGSAVLETINEQGILQKVKCLGLPDDFVPSGSIDELNQDIGLDLEDAIIEIKKFLGLLCVPGVAAK